MSEPRRNEKEEEKRREKQDEKGQSWDEKWQHDPLRMIFIAIILIWGGLVAFAGTQHVFSYNWDAHGWAIFLLATGTILIIKAVIRAVVPEFRRSIGFGLIAGIILLAVGIFDLVGWNWEYIWPVILVAVGLAIILFGVRRRRK
jgi:cation transport ATPase